ncbi:MAG TPA: fumarylacetoacetate hydrolase family protein [Candidatus Limnocylindrales bacterium]|nr:fumarylacetoacetate hydrolase family protein [Candidatus Limnocylindrales bacterium]
MRLYAYRDPTLEDEGPGWSVSGGVWVGEPFPDGLRLAPGVALAEASDGDDRRGRRPAPAISAPGKVVCIGLNYRDHVEEQHIATPDRPILFAKFANAVIADGEPIVRPPGTHALDLEVELGVVIGRTAHRVGRGEALAHVAGYVVVNDVSARDWQGQKAALREGERGDGQWLRAKGSDTFLPMGPVLVGTDEIPDPGALRLRSWRIPGSGPDAGRAVRMQDGTTADMIFDVPALIEFVSAVITLEPGDVIATGTPAGVGVFRHPPVFLEPGDRVRCEIDGIGSVENPIIDWTDEPRLGPTGPTATTRTTEAADA